jgi:hypothetical protein
MYIYYIHLSNASTGSLFEAMLRGGINLDHMREATTIKNKYKRKYK